MRKFSLLSIPFAAMMLFSSYDSSAAIQRQQYFQMGPEKGLCTSCPVDFIYRKGYDRVWVGSGDKVGEMSGTGFKFYKPEAGRVRAILQDETDNLWILADSTLCLYVERGDSFKKMDIAPSAGFVLEDRCLFVAGETVFKYDYASKQISEEASFSTLGSFEIERIYKWTDDTLLLYDSQNGSVIYSVKDGKSSRCVFAPIGCDAFFVDSRYRMWFSKPGQGLECMDAAGNSAGRYTSSNSNLLSDNVLFIGESGNKLVVLTDDGLCRLLPDHSSEMLLEERIPGDPASFPTTAVSDMFCDLDGSIWFSRKSGGIFVDRQVMMESEETASSNIEPLSCMYRPDGQSRIWVGTSGSGVIVYNPRSGGFANISLLDQTVGLDVLSIANFSADELLVSSVDNGFLLLNKNNGSVRPFETGNLVLDSYGSGASARQYEICDGPQGSVMLMSDTDMYRIFPSTRTVSEVRLPESATGKGYLYPAFPGNAGLYYWNAHSLFEYDALSNALVEVFRFEDELTVFSASSDDSNNIWIASDKGIVRFNRSTRKYDVIPLPCACPVNSILSAGGGRIWFGTRIGLGMYDTSNGEFTWVETSDGLFPNSYLGKVKLYATGDEDIYMGGVNGFVRFDSNISFAEFETPELVLEGLWADGVRMSSAHDCKIKPGEQPVAIEVFSKESNPLSEREYRFLVKGPGKYCKEIKSEIPSVTLSALSSGKYSVSASCTLKNGSWTEYIPVTSFVVSGRFFGTFWFYLIVFIILSGLTYYFFLMKYMMRTKAAKQNINNRTSEERLNFLVNVSHELRTPLTLTIQPLEKALDSISTEDQNYRRLKGAVKQAKKMKTLLDTILAASKVEADGSGPKLNLSYQSFNIWVKHIVSDFNEEAEARKINLAVEYDSKIGMLDFDEQKCQVVLSNLLMNAFAHNPDESEIQVWTESHPERATVRVSVSDRGSGIKEEDMSEIFNRFYQSTEDNHGYGVGLAYSKRIMDTMQGVLCAYNNSHGGSTFYFELPTGLSSQDAPVPNAPINEQPATYDSSAQSNDDSPSAVIADTQVPASVPASVIDPNALPFEEPRDIPAPIIDLKNATLLVVEDDTALRNYLREELVDSLKNVLVASNGVEAVKILNSEEVNIVVSDVMMPEMDGFALCRYIKTTVAISHIPVILLTARSDENSRILGYKNGADDYITKPFDIDILKDSIQRLFFAREAVRNRFTSLSPMPSAEEITFSSADEQFLQKFSKIVSDNISDPDLDSKFLVDNMGMSRTVLFNKVKQLTGLNLQNYVNKIRMEHVIKLMSTTNLSLGEIAEQSGFSSPRYFSTSFKNYTGVTPTQYKKDHR